MFFSVHETKGVPLEEVAALFGDTEEVDVFSKDIHVDHNTHNLVVAKGEELTKEVTEGINLGARKLSVSDEKIDVERIV